MDAIHAYSSEASCIQDATLMKGIKWKCVDDRQYDFSSMYSKQERLGAR